MAGFIDLPFHRLYSGTISNFSSVALCKDLRIIHVFNVDSNTVCQGYSNDITAVDSVKNVSYIFSGGTHESYAQVFNIAGELYLSVYRKRITGAYSGFYIYKSPSGNGGDWEVYGTLQETTGIPGHGTFMPPAIPVVTDTGRWVITGPWIDGTWGFGTVCYMGFYVSDDDGVTWTYKARHGSYYNIGQNDSSVRVGYLNGVLVAMMNGDITLPPLWVSEDDGETWYSPYTVTGTFSRPAFYTINGVLYSVEGAGTTVEVRRSANPLINSWPIVDTYTVDTAWRTTFSTIDSWLVIMANRNCSAYIATRPLQTMANVVIVEETTYDQGVMFSDGKYYKYVRTVSSTEITYHPYAGIPVTYSYAGDVIQYAGIAYSFLCSGITDPTKPGGYGDYQPMTTRTVYSMADRENFVNFYYVEGGVFPRFAWTYKGYDPANGELTLGPYKMQSWGFFVGAAEWNQLIAAVIALYSQKGWSLNSYPMYNVTVGGIFTAALFNQVKNAIGSKSPTGIADKVATNQVTAADLNTLMNVLNAIE